MRYHSQNLNERYVAGQRLRGSKLRHGRAWLDFGKLGFRWSWNFFSDSSTAIGVRADSGDGPDVTFHVAIKWLFSLFLTIEWAPLIRFLRLDYQSAKDREARLRAGAAPGVARDIVPASYDTERDLSLRFFDGAVWWSLWWRSDYSTSRDPRWRCGCWHPLDTLLGREKHRCVKLLTQDVLIPMPEATYPATVDLERDEWRRPRWPWARVRFGSNVKIPKGIPIPGKGENSYDCGPDALFGRSSSDTTVEGAIAGVVKSVLGDRRKRGAPADYAERDDAAAEVAS